MPKYSLWAHISYAEDPRNSDEFPCVTPAHQSFVPLNVAWRKTVSSLRDKSRGPELTVEDLCKFVRMHFGPASVHIAQQHVDAYKNRGYPDVAATWSNVRDQLKKQDQEIKGVA